MEGIYRFEIHCMLLENKTAVRIERVWLPMNLKWHKRLLELVSWFIWIKLGFCEQQYIRCHCARVKF